MSKGGAPSQQRKRELEEVQKELDAELEEWTKAEMDPSNITVNAFMMDTKLQAVIDAIMGELGITEDQLNLYFKERLLKELVQFREKIQPQVEEARRQALLPSEVERGLLGPDGKPILRKVE